MHFRSAHHLHGPLIAKLISKDDSNSFRRDVDSILILQLQRSDCFLSKVVVETGTAAFQRKAKFEDINASATGILLK